MSVLCRSASHEVVRGGRQCPALRFKITVGPPLHSVEGREKLARLGLESLVRDSGRGAAAAGRALRQAEWPGLTASCSVHVWDTPCKGYENSEVRMTEDERLGEIERLTAALDELCLPYRNDDTDMYDDLIKQMPETEQ